MEATDTVSSSAAWAVVVAAFVAGLERLVYFAIGPGSTQSDAGQMFGQIREMESRNVTELIAEAKEIVERLDRRTSAT